MPLQKLQFRPGVNREGTTLANEGGWFESEKVRFRSGYPEKIGGWSVVDGSFANFLGVARSLWNWTTLNNYTLLGVGTSLKFYVASGGAYYDITPISTRGTVTLTSPFAATDGSSTIVVTDASFSGQTGDFVVFSGASDLFSPSGGNISAAVLNQQYQITYISAGKYSIQARTAGTSVEAPGAFVLANGSDSGNGGTVTTKYLIGPGGATSTVGTGWGVGPFSPYLFVTVTNPFTAASTGVSVLTVTQAGHGLITGDWVYFASIGSATEGTYTGTVCGITAAKFQRAFQVTTFGPYTTTGASGSAGTATLTFATAATKIPVGSTIVVSGVTPLGYNGTFTVTASTTASVSYANTTTGAQTVAGSITVPNIYNISTALLTPPFTTTSYAASGGSVIVHYPDRIGGNIASYNRGWGSGYTVGVSGVTAQLRLWTQANFGENLLFSYRGGPFYIWQPLSDVTPAYGNRGTLVSGTNVPSKINQILVSDASRIVICLGCDDYGTYNTLAQDPLLIRWSTNESYTDWTPTTSNQAGSYRLSRGSIIVCGLQTRQEILVWTNAALYSMQYLGPPYVFGFNLLADNISIISPNAMATANGVTYWMGQDKFYVYSGRVETLPCALRAYVFDDINQAQASQFFAGTNEGFSEIWWFYCSSKSTAIDRYVIFNYLDRVWYYGSLNRTAWLDSPVRTYPQATTSVQWATLPSNIDDVVTTIPVSSTGSFPNSGVIQIDDEIITYATKDNTNFINCIRGDQGSIAVSHVANTNVKLYASNLLVFHESAVDDGTTNPPSPIYSYIQSSDFDIGDGHNYGFVWQMVPDITFDGSNATSYVISAGNFKEGAQYQIINPGDTDFTLIGAANNLTGTVFTATAYTITAGNFVIDRQYTIVSIGTTDFTLIGASSNKVGVVFIATDVGTGTGTARTSAAGTGTGTAVTSSTYPQVTFSIRPRQNPGAPYSVAASPTVTSKDSYGVAHYYNVQQFTELIYTRARGRQMALKVESNALGTQWQLGTPRMNVRPDGRR